MFKFFKFSIFNTSLTKKYNPYINYTWQMLPNAKVKNSGTSGVDLQLYSGNPLDFQATQGVQVNKSFTLSGNAISLYLGFDTDSIAITHTLAEFDNLKVSIVNAILRVTINSVNHDVATLSIDTYYQTEIVVNNNNLTVKLNGTQTYSASCTALNTTILKSLGANDGLASGRFDGQFDYFIVYNGLTTFSLPNQFFKDMSTDVNTLFCTDFGGNSGYVADDRNVSVGSEQLVNGSFDTDLTGWVNTNTHWEWVNGKAHFPLSSAYNYLLQYLPLVRVPHLIEFDLDIVSGEMKCEHDGTFTSWNTSGRKSYIALDGQKAIFTRYTETEFYIDNVTAKPISAVYPITNYSATQRTNFTQVNKGLQELMIERNSLGFFLGLRDYPKGNGVGWADTEWIPSADEDWTIEISVFREDDGSFRLNGTTDGVMQIGKHSVAGFMRAKILGASYDINCLKVGENDIVIRHNSSNNTFDVFRNKVNKALNKATASVQPTSSFILFKQSTFFVVTDIPKFKVHKKLLTDEEIQAL